MPARLTTHFTLAMWLWREHGYEEVLRQLLDGLGWAGVDDDGDGPDEGGYRLEGHSKVDRHSRMSRWVRSGDDRVPDRLSGVDAAAGIL